MRTVLARSLPLRKRWVVGWGGRLLLSCYSSSFPSQMLTPIPPRMEKDEEGLFLVASCCLGLANVESCLMRVRMDPSEASLPDPSNSLVSFLEVR